MSSHLGFQRYGDGPLRVLVLHDWFCDHSSWDALLPYLTPTRFTYVFADVRGYGASRDLTGSYTLEEAAGDVLALLESLGWERFSLVGHSMSGLIVQRVAMLAKARVSRVVAVTPVPPGGLQGDRATVEFFQGLALAQDEERFSKLSSLWGTRLSETWIRFKLRRWRETAEPNAVAQYVPLWCSTDVSEQARGLEIPILVISAEQDAPPFRREALEQSMLPYYPNAKVLSIGESGHYPMQEQPPLLATMIERFLAE